MARVDQLAAELAHLAVGPIAVVVAVHASADAAGSLVDRRCQSLVLERERGVQTGNAGTDDGDARHRAACRGCWTQQRGGAKCRHRRKRAALLEETAA